MSFLTLSHVSSCLVILNVVFGLTYHAWGQPIEQSTESQAQSTPQTWVTTPTSTLTPETAKQYGPEAPLATQQEEIVLPSDVTLPPDQAVLRYLFEQKFFNPFPDNLFYPEAPISRAEFVTLLHRASGLKTAFVSEFAYFIDVPTDFWAYFPIESFRMQDIVSGAGHGYFYPHQPIKRLDAAVMLSKTFPENWLKLTSQEIEETLSAYKLHIETIPTWAKEDLSRSIYTGFLLPVQHQDVEHPSGEFILALETPLTRMDAARMVYRRALMAEEERFPADRQESQIPAGIVMNISPTTAVSKNQLFLVGQSLYFALIEPVTLPSMNVILPRGTRIHGAVTQSALSNLQTTLSFDKATLPSGEPFRLYAKLSLTFEPEKEETFFIVPGEAYQVRTTDATVLK